jgi:hypothetical protein
MHSHLRAALGTTLLLAACARGPAPDPARIAIPVQPAALPSASERAPAAAGPAEDPVLRRLVDPACTIRDVSGTVVFSLILRVGGRPFAVVGGEVRDVELRLQAGTAGGTVSVTRNGIALTGEIGLQNFAVVHRNGQLHDGWLEIHAGWVTTVDGDGHIATRLNVPEHVEPQVPPSQTLECASATIFSPAPPRGGTHGYVKDGTKTPLRLTPKGPPFAQLVVPAGSGRQPTQEIRTLERSGTQARIRIGPFDRASYAWGWVDAAVIETPIMLVPINDTPRFEPAPFTRRCTHEVPILVRDGGVARRVGVVKAGTPFGLFADRGAELAIDLRLIPATGETYYELPPIPTEPDEGPFVRGSSLDDCQNKP